MDLQKIGSTGIQIPNIVFGTSALGNLYTALDFDTKLEIVKQCFENVPTPVVFDSAGKYGAGLALEMLGNCLEQLNISPQDVIISNKLGWLRTNLKTPEPTFETGVWEDIRHDAVQCISYSGIKQCWEQGNQLLRNYKPQLVSVHDPDEYLAMSKTPFEREKLFNDILGAYKALEELKAKGEVKAIGIGAKDWKVIKELEAHVSFDWVMFANSFTIMKHPDELIEFMQSLSNKGIAIINSAVFHAGFLIGGDFFDYKKIQPDTDETKAIFNWRTHFFILCKKYNILPAHACVHFGKSAPGVVAIALNTSKPHNVKNNVDAVNCNIPIEFYNEMKINNLIDKHYQIKCTNHG